MVVAFVRPRLPITVLKEHLNATPQQILPAGTHRCSQRILVDLDQFTCRGGRTGGRVEGRKQEEVVRGISQSYSLLDLLGLYLGDKLFCACHDFTEILGFKRNVLAHIFDFMVYC